MSALPIPRGISCVLALAVLAAAAPAWAALHQYSYDPADEATRTAAGGLTFEINKTLFSTRVLKVRATEAKATADLKPADPSAVGRSAALWAGEPDHDLYEVLAKDDGPALIAAFCPGSKRAWMAFSPLRPNEDLRVLVFGDDPKGGAARRCRRLDFTYHGEWLLPPGPPPPLGEVGPPEFPKQ
jgi:hypothetical protein